MQLLQALLEVRFLEGRWQLLEVETHKLVILQTLRILTRDRQLQRRFLTRGGGEELVNVFDEEGARHLSEPLRQGAGAQNPLVHVASMLAKLDANSPLLVNCKRTLCQLLATSERFLLQGVLASLYKLSASPLVITHCQGLLQTSTGDGMSAGEKLLEILSSDKMKSEYRQLAGEIVLCLCQTEENRCLVESLEGIKLLLGMAQNCSENLLLLTLRILERLVQYDSRQALHQDAVRQVRTLGGINVVLNLINRVNDGQDACRQQVLMTGCGLLAELALDDDNSFLILQLNGVLVLTKVIVAGWGAPQQPARASRPAPGGGPAKSERAVEETAHLNAQALRALRMLFSLERNRRSFKRVFPPSIFERFIEIGQYQRELSKYRPLAAMLASLPPEKQTSMRKAVNEMRADLDSDRRVREYLLLGDAIGKGAFGTIWRARMAGAGAVHAPAHYALKEIHLEGPECEDDEKTHREVKLLSQMQHPNIVRYIDSFTDKAVASSSQRSLYIVMELVDGASIAQLISSQTEKKESISERVVRELLLSISHALYYIHKKKCITHRDLTPSNVLLSSDPCPLTGQTRQKTVLVDFGLARQRETDMSVMASVVGTLTYSCPELIQRQPYTDKADIWSLGVILYQLVALKNPFTDNNPLQTARKIVEGEIEPIHDPHDMYSQDLKTLIMKMLTPKANERPDIIEVMQEMGFWDRADKVTKRDAMERTDALYIQTQELEQRIRELEVR
jgi:NIMA (never in mitosis gene a)-related kinase